MMICHTPARSVTLLTIKETPKAVSTEIDFSADTLTVLAENVLFLQQLTTARRLHRVLSVVKIAVFGP